MPHNHLCLFFTQLLTASFESSPPVKVLRKLLQRADVTSVEGTLEQQLWRLLGLPTINNIPLAALTALADNLPAHQGWWLYAEPIELQADQTTVYLVGSEHLELTATELMTLQAELKTWLAQDGLQLWISESQHWYLQLAEQPHITTYSVAQAQGKAIHDFLPSGPDQSYWRKLFTELQMLLHTSSVNQQRQQRGQPLITGLWFWGLGQLPNVKTQPSWNRVWSDIPYVRGLAQLTGCPVSPMQSLSQCLTQMNQEQASYLLVDDTNRSLTEFDYLANALRKNQLASVTVYPGGRHVYRLTRSNLRRWWRRNFIRVSQ